MFTAALSGMFSVVTDDEGYYCIDRDGESFGCILNFLRGSTLAIPTNPVKKARLLEEADFYSIDPLVDLIRGDMPSALFDKEHPDPHLPKSENFAIVNHTAHGCYRMATLSGCTGEMRQVL